MLESRSSAEEYIVPPLFSFQPSKFLLNTPTGENPNRVAIEKHENRSKNYTNSTNLILSARKYLPFNLQFRLAAGKGLSLEKARVFDVE